MHHAGKDTVGIARRVAAATRSSRSLMAAALVGLGCGVAPTGHDDMTADLRPVEAAPAATHCGHFDVRPETGDDTWRTIAVGEKIRYKAWKWSCAENRWVNMPVSWSSSNTSVATVTPGGYYSNWWGEATGVAAGNTTITGFTASESDGAPLEVTAQPLGVYITGPSEIARYQSAQYTANVTGQGTSPFTYEWRTRDGANGSFGAWSPWSSTGTQNYTYTSVNNCGINMKQLEVRVTDAGAKTATNYIQIGVTNPC